MRSIWTKCFKTQIITNSPSSERHFIWLKRGVCLFVYRFVFLLVDVGLLYPSFKLSYALQENGNVPHIRGRNHLQNFRLIRWTLPFRFGSIRFVIGRFLTAQRRCWRLVVIVSSTTGHVLTGTAATAMLTMLTMLVAQ